MVSILGALAGCAVSGFAITSVEPEPALQWGILILLLSLFGLLGSIPFFKRIRLRSDGKAFEATQEECTAEFADSGVTLEHPSTKTVYEWSAFEGWGVVDGVAIFWRKTGQHVLVPMRALPNPTDLEQIRAMIPERLPSIQF